MQIDRDRARDLKGEMERTAEMVGVDFGDFSFDDVTAGIEEIDDDLERYKKEYSENEKRLEDRLNPSDRKRREARKAWLEAMIEGLESAKSTAQEYAGIVQNTDELERQHFRDNIAALEHEQRIREATLNQQMARGEITEEEFEQALKLSQLEALHAKQNELNDLYETALGHYNEEKLTLQELNDIEYERMQNELAILELQREQNGESSEQLDVARELFKERQRLVLQSRSGALSDEDRARIKELESKIIADMTMAGASQEAIDAAIAGFKNSAPSYDVGTAYVPADMVARVHEGERIIPKMENDQLVKSLRIMQATMSQALTTQGGGSPISNLYLTIERGAVAVNGVGGDTAEIGGMVVDRLVSEVGRRHAEWHRKNPYGS
jgi:hypothetical protein